MQGNLLVRFYVQSVVMLKLGPVRCVCPCEARLGW